ncbi:CT20-domain-containing protein [Choiromyces venosus 120613-1]|uniref:CT20-domain-containing protein n=1 Tax=Choiromyces venosus 120613-1 TaxID=1336337 RepID=A0A3N4JA53_9PEZI|nr:CT20-domain-containing protein [Choiromyces venosus 120613-1]
MPPKKKNKGRHAAADGDSPHVPEPIIFDGWTDEQETTLFKAIAVYRLKPAGVHKHFRIIGIAELMKNHGVSDTHTNIEGIWRKLQSQYNLEGLDEREDIEDDLDTPDPTSEFALPADEYGALMFSRRLDPNNIDSPLTVVPQTFWATGMKGKKGGRAARSESVVSGAGTATASVNPDDTEDESVRPNSPIPTKTRKNAAKAGTPSTSTTTTTASRRKPPVRKKGVAAKAKPSPKRKPAAKPVSSEEESNASDDELSELPDDVDGDEDAGTVAETEAGEEEPEAVAESEMGESTAAAGIPPPVPKKRGRKPGSKKAVPPPKKGAKKGDVRRSSRRK